MLPPIVLAVYVESKLARRRPDLVFQLRGNLPKSASSKLPQEHGVFFGLFPLKPQLVLSLLENLPSGIDDLSPLPGVVDIACYAQCVHNRLPLQRSEQIHQFCQVSLVRNLQCTDVLLPIISGDRQPPAK